MCALRTCSHAHAHTHTHLRVLQEGSFVVGAAATAVPQRLGVLGPAPVKHHFMPGLLQAHHRGVDEAADVGLREVLAPVCEGHPVVVRKHTGDTRLVCKDRPERTAALS